MKDIKMRVCLCVCVDVCVDVDVDVSVWKRKRKIHKIFKILNILKQKSYGILNRPYSEKEHFNFLLAIPILFILFN